MHSKPILSHEFTVLHFLQKRMKLPREFQMVYTNHEKGYRGELKFAQMLRENLTGDILILHSFLLEGYDRSEFQLDCLILFREEIYAFEIKNYEGNVYYQDNRFFYAATREEMKNPFPQMERATFLLNKWIEKSGNPFPVRAYTVFVNDAFTLFQAPMNLPMLLPTQLKRLMEKLNRIPDGLTDRHYRLAERLSALHKKKSNHERLPAYQFDALKKGVVCRDCAGIMVLDKKGDLGCTTCIYTEGIDSAVMRNVVELNTLFPATKIKTTLVLEWCAEIVTIKVIRRILSTYMIKVDKGNQTYYIFPK